MCIINEKKICKRLVYGSPNLYQKMENEIDKKPKMKIKQIMWNEYTKQNTYNINNINI